MIDTPYKTLRDALRKPEGWHPAWAQRLEVRRQADVTYYAAHPEAVDAPALTELAELDKAGWHVTIDSQRLSRIRINIWK